MEAPAAAAAERPPPSPLTGCYLLIVAGEPREPAHRDIVLQRVAKGLLSWDLNDCLVDLERELAIITDQGLEGEEARYGERLIQFASENLVTEILVHPSVSTLQQCMRNLLASFTRHRHIIHAGYTFQGSGSWSLQDGTFSAADFSEAFQEIEVQRVIRAYENSISIDIHCSTEGDWGRLPKETFTKACKVRVNPTDVLTTGSPSITNFINYITPFLVSTSLENILESSDVVGNIRFSRPTLYVFPGGQGDAALFGINGFNMLLDGGYSRKACFWDFVRHLDRLDAVLMTRLNNSNVGGISSVLKRKKQDAVYPQIGHFFCNIQERKALPSPDGDKDKDPLLVNLLDEGQEIISNLKHLNLTPQGCYRDSDPINLYHKVGHGTLDMYVLSPDKNSREVREFLQKWNQSDAKLFVNPRGRDFVFPLQNVISICCLLVWQPANPSDTITRILYPGSTPQKKIFEGLDKLKTLEFVKHPVCSERSIAPVKKSKEAAILEKILPKERAVVADKKEKIMENKVIEKITNGEMNGDVKEKVKKSDSTESEKSAKTKKPDDPNGSKPKPKPQKHGDSQQRKKPAEKKASPTTPKKSVDDRKPAKPSPSDTPAKSAKDANNRRVIENKKSAPPRKEPKATPSEPAKPKIERMPISRRPKAAKGPVSPMKKSNGIQKPDSISRKGKLEKEGTTDSSTVSTPSADQESVLKKDISKLDADEIQDLKAQELADLKEEQEAVKEIEAVFRKGEDEVPVPEAEARKVKDISIDEKLDAEEYLIIEREEIEHDSLDEREAKEDETQKLARDSEESEKRRKPSAEDEKILDKREEIQEEVKQIVQEAEEIVKSKSASPEAKEPMATSPEEKEKDTASIEKKTAEKDAEEEIKEVVESQPDEKVSANVESGATTTAPTLPEDERIPLDEIKEDNGAPVDEKHVKEETKEKDNIPVIQLPPKTLETASKLPPVVGIRLDKQTHIRDIVKTPDEVADLPVHEEVDFGDYQDEKKTNEVEKAKEVTEEAKVSTATEKTEDKPKQKGEAAPQSDILEKADVETKEKIEGKPVEEMLHKEDLKDALEEEEWVVVTKEETGKIEKDRKEETKVEEAQEVKCEAQETLEKLENFEEALKDKVVSEKIGADEKEKELITEKQGLDKQVEEKKIEPDDKIDKLNLQKEEKKYVEEKSVPSEEIKKEDNIEEKQDATKDEKPMEEAKPEEKLTELKIEAKVSVKNEEIKKEDKEEERKDAIDDKIEKQDVQKEEKKDVEGKTLPSEEIKKENQVEIKEDVTKDQKHTEDAKLEDKPPELKIEMNEGMDNQQLAGKTQEDSKKEEVKPSGDAKDPVEIIKAGSLEKLDEPVNLHHEPSCEDIQEEIQKEETEQMSSMKIEREEMSKIGDKLDKLKQTEYDKEEKSMSEAVELPKEDIPITLDQARSPEHAEKVTLPDSSPEEEDKLKDAPIEKAELGRKSPQEREEDVKKIVASVAEVLKSEAPLEEFEGKIPFTTTPYAPTYTTELRETHITTQDSPGVESKPLKIDDIPSIPEEEASALQEEAQAEDKRTSLMKESEGLMKATSKIISDIKGGKSEEDADLEDTGVVKRMLVTASSEDGGEETEICPPGTIIFPRSSESSGRSSPEHSAKVSQKSSIVDTLSDSLTTIKQVKESSEKDSGIDDTEDIKDKESSPSEKDSIIEMKTGEDKQLSGKSTPDKDASIKSLASGKSTPDISDLDVKSKEPSPLEEVKQQKEEKTEDKSVLHKIEDKLIEEEHIIEDKIGKVTNNIEETLTEKMGELRDIKKDIVARISSEEEEIIHDIKGFKETTWEKATGIYESVTAGITKLEDGILEATGFKEHKDLVVSSEDTAKVADKPDAKKEEKVATSEDLTGKDLKVDEKERKLSTVSSGKSTPDVKEEVKLSGKSSPDLKEENMLDGSPKQLSRKSTPDVLSGKVTPEVDSRKTSVDEKIGKVSLEKSANIMTDSIITATDITKDIFDDRRDVKIKEAYSKATPELSKKEKEELLFDEKILAKEEVILNHLDAVQQADDKKYLDSSIKDIKDIVEEKKDDLTFEKCGISTDVNDITEEKVDENKKREEKAEKYAEEISEKESSDQEKVPKELKETAADITKSKEDLEKLSDDIKVDKETIEKDEKQIEEKAKDIIEAATDLDKLSKEIPFETCDKIDKETIKKEGKKVEENIKETPSEKFDKDDVKVDKETIEKDEKQIYDKVKDIQETAVDLNKLSKEVPFEKCDKIDDVKTVKKEEKETERKDPKETADESAKETTGDIIADKETMKKDEKQIGNEVKEAKETTSDLDILSKEVSFEKCDKMDEVEIDKETLQKDEKQIDEEVKQIKDTASDLDKLGKEVTFEKCDTVDEVKINKEILHKDKEVKDIMETTGDLDKLSKQVPFEKCDRIDEVKIDRETIKKDEKEIDEKAKDINETAKDLDKLTKEIPFEKCDKMDEVKIDNERIKKDEKEIDEKVKDVKETAEDLHKLAKDIPFEKCDKIDEVKIDKDTIKKDEKEIDEKVKDVKETAEDLDKLTKEVPFEKCDKIDEVKIDRETIKKDEKEIDEKVKDVKETAEDLHKLAKDIPFEKCDKIDEVKIDKDTIKKDEKEIDEKVKDVKETAEDLDKLTKEIPFEKCLKDDVKTEKQKESPKREAKDIVVKESVEVLTKSVKETPLGESDKTEELKVDKETMKKDEKQIHEEVKETATDLAKLSQGKCDKIEEVEIDKETIKKDEKEIDEKVKDVKTTVEDLEKLVKETPFEKCEKTDELKLDKDENKISAEVKDIKETTTDLDGLSRDGQFNKLDEKKVDKETIKKDEKQIYEEVKEKCDRAEDFEIDKEAVKREEKEVDEKVKDVKETAEDLEKLLKETPFEKCEKTDEETVDKESIKKDEKQIDDKVKDVEETAADLDELSKEVPFEKCDKKDEIKVDKETKKDEKEPHEEVKSSADLDKVTKEATLEKCIDEKVKDTKETTQKEEKQLDQETKESVDVLKSTPPEKSDEMKDFKVDKKDLKRDEKQIDAEVKETKETSDNLEELTRCVSFGKMGEPFPKDEKEEYDDFKVEKRTIKKDERQIDDELSEMKETVDHLNKMTKSVSFDKCEKISESKSEKESMEKQEKTNISKDDKDLKHALKDTENVADSVVLEHALKFDDESSDMSKSVFHERNEPKDLKEALREAADVADSIVLPNAAKIESVTSPTRIIDTSSIKAEFKELSQEVDKSTTSTVVEQIVDKLAADVDTTSVEAALKLTPPKTQAKKLSISEVEVSLDEPKDTPGTSSTAEQYLGGTKTPPTAPVSPVVKEEPKRCPEDKQDSYEKTESDEEDLSIKSQAGHGFVDEKQDPMAMSFYGSLPEEDESFSATENKKKDPIESWGKPLGLPAPTYLYEITKARYSATSTLADQKQREEDLMMASFYGELPSNDNIASWGKPLKLPSPAPLNNEKGTPKKERKLPANVTAKNKLNDDRKRADSPKYKGKKVNPVYVDLTYVPHHGNAYYTYADFFKRVRARYYVFSGLEPSRQVYDALLEAKQTWEDKELEVTIIPTYDTDILGYWVAENEELLAKCKIDLSPSASRCTINLQDHETSCSAYRLEF